MFRSNSFVATADRIERQNRDSPDAVRSGFERAFRAGARSIPAGMLGELFSYLFDRYEAGEVTRQAFGDMLDLLAMEYDDQNDPLHSNDWRTLAELVDEYAADMDMKLVQYIMERVLSHRAL